MANDRPRIAIATTESDTMLETAGWMTLVMLWGAALHGYFTLPAVIPTHFDGAGRPDNFGPKAMIFLLPLLGTLLYAGLTLLNRYPHTFNYPVPVTPANAARLYALGTRTVRALKASVLAIFLVIVMFTHLTASGQAAGLPWWFFPLAAGLVVVPVACCLPPMSRTGGPKR